MAYSLYLIHEEGQIVCSKNYFHQNESTLEFANIALLNAYFQSCDDNGLKPLTLISKNTVIGFSLLDYTYESLKQFEKQSPGDEPSRHVLVLLASKTAGQAHTQLVRVQAFLKTIQGVLCGLLGYFAFMSSHKPTQMQELKKRVTMSLESYSRFKEDLFNSGAYGTLREISEQLMGELGIEYIAIFLYNELYFSNNEWKSLAAQDIKIIQNLVLHNEFGLISDRSFYVQHSQLTDKKNPNNKAQRLVLATLSNQITLALLCPPEFELLDLFMWLKAQFQSSNLNKAIRNPEELFISTLHEKISDSTLAMLSVDRIRNQFYKWSNVQEINQEEAKEEDKGYQLENPLNFSTLSVDEPQFNESASILAKRRFTTIEHDNGTSSQFKNFFEQLFVRVIGAPTCSIPLSAGLAKDQPALSLIELLWGHEITVNSKQEALGTSKEYFEDEGFLLFVQRNDGKFVASLHRKGDLQRAELDSNYLWKLFTP